MTTSEDKNIIDGLDNFPVPQKHRVVRRESLSANIHNTELDGHFEVSHFTNPEFNEATYNALHPRIVAFLSNHKNKQSVQFIDACAGRGDLSAVIKEKFDSDEYMQDFMQGIGMEPGKLTMYVVDVDNNKLVDGKRARAENETTGVTIAYKLGDIKKLPKLGINMEVPTYMYMRAATHYFVPDGYDPLNNETWPEAIIGKPYTQEQFNLYQSFADTLYTNGEGAELSVIESTGDELGLRRFEQLLALITKSNGDHKSLRYLTTPQFKQMINDVDISNRNRIIGDDKRPARMRIDTSYPVKGDYGSRNIHDLYRRYGGDKDYEEFRQSVLGYYEQIKAEVPGETTMFTEDDGDLIIHVDYMIHNIVLTKRR